MMKRGETAGKPSPLNNLDMQKIVAIVLSVMAAAAPALAFLLGRKSVVIPPQEIQRDTIVFVDTIRIPHPVPREVIKRDTILMPADTLTLHDTLFVELERETLSYADSLYRAVVSGVRPSLDLIEVYPRTIHTTETRIVKARPKVGIGIHAGYGASKDGLSPYIGVGVHYNVISW